jgi:hypothetical protein
MASIIALSSLYIVTRFRDVSIFALYGNEHMLVRCVLRCGHCELFGEVDGFVCDLSGEFLEQDSANAEPCILSI